MLIHAQNGGDLTLLPPEEGAFFTGKYRDLLTQSGITPSAIDERIEDTFQQLFYGDDSYQRIYYPVGDDMAYMLDTGNNDVRSEGMSYGMMIAVQLDRQEEFDRLWKWAKTYMYQEEAPYAGYFAWHCTPEGEQLDANPAPDGEEWFVMALFFAAHRWGNREGIFNYEAEANAILHTMLHTEDGQRGIETNAFDEETTYVVFVPRMGELSQFTDPSYHLPHFYELWARWAAEDNDFWARAAQESRAFFHNAAHPETYLMTNYTTFSGEPKAMSGYGEYFGADAWRIGMNIAADYAWFAADPWQIDWVNGYLGFFHEQGIKTYVGEYTWEGEPQSPWHSTGLVAMNATAALAATDPIAWEFVQEFWNTPIPTGQYRYYDGLLYLFGLLHLSGNFQIYTPTG
ncbi:MAG: glycoside hydrolase [Anaerolineae bacterium]|nr:glycoside hydrolase [Anaerolineae bacterium]